jgi:6-phosphofructokinase 2
MLEQLIHKEAIAFEAVAVQSWTRKFCGRGTIPTSTTVLVLRVVNSEQEESNILNDRKADSPSFVASGSLNEGLPTDFINS